MRKTRPIPVGRMNFDTLLPVEDLRERILASGDAMSAQKPRPPRTEQEVRFWTGLEKAMMSGELDFYTKRVTKLAFQGFWEALRPVLASGQFDPTISKWVKQNNPTFLEEQTALGNVAGVDEEGWIIFKDKIQGKRSRNDNAED